ncbi:MAG TPA: hypothetical protein P5064_06255 [Clostridia bacterium]|jgi:hypothetical protein|nr:hypothetical protein [Clostridiaceae bacterium]HOF25862.1 hypothetical protein [Clostridia bacterium]HOM33695.1 hypothetical protein [Clostridia bacterium]HOR88887.1 hypothetical protein [Clostridia bacterium]HOT71118.1 hypothetical protein [Clostridia bacterium]
MRKIFRFIVILFILLSMLFSYTGCQEKVKESSIPIETAGTETAVVPVESDTVSTPNLEVTEEEQTDSQKEVVTDNTGTEVPGKPSRTYIDNMIFVNGKSLPVFALPGVFRSLDGNLVRKPTNQDFKNLQASRDPVTHEITGSLPNEVLSVDGEEPVNADSLVIYAGPYDYEFKYTYIEKDGRRQPVFSHGTDLQLTRIPMTNKYAVVKGGFLFWVDLDAETMDLYCLSETMGYSMYDNFWEIDGIKYLKVWAIRPSFNRDGTKMLFYTERATEEVGYVWVKDTVTGEEKPVPNTPAFTRVLQWRENRYAYLQSFGKIIEIDTVELTARTVFDNEEAGSNSFNMIYPYVFNSVLDKDRNIFSEIINLNDGSKRKFEDSKYQRCDNITVVPNTNLLLLRYAYPQENNPIYHEAVILDLVTGKRCVISVPLEYNISSIYQYREYYVVNLYKYGDINNVHDQTSYFIPRTEIRFTD